LESRTIDAVRLRLGGYAAISPPTRGDLVNAYRIVLSRVDKLMETAQEARVPRPAILFSASQPGEGCSTIALNFARCAAERDDANVVIVQCEQPPASAIATEPGLGWVDVASGAVSPAEGTRRLDGSNLHLLPRGGRLGRAAMASLGDDAVQGLVARLKQDFSYVIVDAPPFSARAELVRWLSSVDGVVLVIEANRTRRETLIPIVEFLKESSTLLGVVLNKRRHFIPDWIYQRL